LRASPQHPDLFNVKKDAHCRYTTIQNWSNNVYNLVTKRAVAQAGASMEWIDGNIGSKVTMKYPAVCLMGEPARGETLSVAFAGEGQHQDAGAKMVHCAPSTSSQRSPRTGCYLMSRGMTEDEAMAMIVRGFVEPIAHELPMEYALELNRLIELQMEGAVG
jgi:Fe-S cluster assembly scaffold protein SufB